jgi:hypothetical protein
VDSSLPSVLALPLREYLSQANPVLKLWAACDAVELTLRLAVSLGLADLARPGICRLPSWPSCSRGSRSRRWAGGAAWRRRSCGTWPGDGAAFPELRPLVEEVIAPLLDGSAPRRTPESSLSALRNHLAHGGGVTQAAAQKTLASWGPRLEEAFSKLAWLEDVTLVVKTKDGCGALKGPQIKPSPLSPEAPEILATAFLQGHAIVALRGTLALPLWPLAIFGQPKGPDSEAPLARNEAPQVFARRGDVWMQYTPLGSEEVCLSEGSEGSHQVQRTTS